MWFYIVIGIIVVILLAVAFLMYKGYSKVKPKPIPGIPCPPFTHTIFGHPDKMMSPLKHILRLEAAEIANTPYHQLVLFQHSSVFINDAEEAGDLLNQMKSKGAIYDIFRYQKTIPDSIASDGDNWSMRSKALRPSLLKVRFDTNKSETSTILKNLQTKLKSFSESGEPMDLMETMTYLSMDIVSQSIFHYPLNALTGASEGVGLHKCLTVLSEHMAGQGIYANPKARKYTPQEITAVTTDWRNFINKLTKHAKTISDEYKAKHNDLDVSNNFMHALIQLVESKKVGFSKTPFGEPELFSEVHQVFRHGHECIAGTLVWAFYALFRYPKIRAKLESELVANANSSYLDCFLKEVLRKYPVSGNLTVRTAEEVVKLSKGKTLPAGTPVHFHMWTLHNSSREWDRAHEFVPERWEDAELPANATDREKVVAKRQRPTCPYLAANADKSDISGINRDYDVLLDGSGFSENALSYFPFAAGTRSCPVKGFVTQVLKKVLVDVILTYRLEAFETNTGMENDPGQSNNAVVVPLFKQSTNVRVDRVSPSELGKLPKKKDDGWAPDDDDEEATPRK